MFAYIGAALFFVLFAVGVLRDRRRFSNAVFLGIALAFLGISLIYELNRAPLGVAEVVTVLILVVPALGTLAVAVFLAVNGVKMVRKEGRSPTNFLSLFAGLSIFGVIALLIAAFGSDSRPLIIITGTTFLLVCYVSFLFLCFIAYAFLYSRMRVRGTVDFVIVLGSGLIDGHRVPPLLASRLDRGRAVYEAQRARGADPLLITSGGQGPDEQLPESHAMADHLVEGGFPADRILREDRSSTTEENLAFSRVLMEERRPGHRCVIVTNNYHAFRAALLARRTGVNGQVVGAPTAAYFWPSATIREFVAVFLSHKTVNFGACLLLGALGTAAWWDV
ncbi:ElyC/SanA/YdcF family protein [Streptomyces sp. NPDC052114]|uniref:YdcF family protein n=1 Tax=unclassified Streptomyces TaxID=2593676 RepID=UPI0034257070